MEMLPWSLVGLLAAYHIAALFKSMRKRVRMNSYALLLLLDDEVRQTHQRRFHDWIDGSRSTSAVDLSNQASGLLQRMADDLHPNGLIAAHAKLVERKKLGR